MKSLYPGYFKPSNTDFQAMWQDGIFVFDANVLLNLYRYSQATREQLLTIISEFGNRIWIPRKVADEFFDHRLEVLGKQIKQYDEMKTSLERILADLENPRQHPFVIGETLEAIKKLFGQVQSELANSQKHLLEGLNNDEILHNLGELLEGKVGPNFTSDELDAIYTEGAKRVEKKIPPGFMDAKEKAKCGDNYCIYGDLIIWKQILLKAKADQRGVIFVSDDKKEDWWLEFNGRRISPLPFLTQEFHDETKQLFFMYTVEKYVENSGEFLKTNINPEVIKEVIDIRETAKLDNYRFDVISEQELIDRLKSYESLISLDPHAYVGLKTFVTVVLGQQGYEINHSYAIINNLIQQGIVKLYEKPTGQGMAKAITLQPQE